MLQSMGWQRVGHAEELNNSKAAILWLPKTTLIGKGASLIHLECMAQTIKNPPAMRETWSPSQGWEDPLEEGRATHSSVLAWRILMDRGAWRTACSPWDRKETDMSE